MNLTFKFLIIWHSSEEVKISISNNLKIKWKIWKTMLKINKTIHLLLLLVLGPSFFKHFASSSCAKDHLSCPNLFAFLCEQSVMTDPTITFLQGLWESSANWRSVLRKVIVDLSLFLIKGWLFRLEFYVLARNLKLVRNFISTEAISETFVENIILRYLGAKSKKSVYSLPNVLCECFCSKIIEACVSLGFL